MMRKVSVFGIALFLSFVFCSVSEAKSLKKGEEFYEYKRGKPTGEIIRIVSSDELEIEKGKDIILGKYTIDGERMRIVATVLGTTKAGYYKITSDGLVDEKTRVIYYSKAGLAAETKKRAAETRKRVKEKDKFIISNLTILDKETKLMWTRDADMAGQIFWDDALKFIEKLNKQKYAGYSDWRLSSKEELVALVNLNLAEGAGYTDEMFLNEIGFKNVASYFYWSSSDDVSGEALNVNFGFRMNGIPAVLHFDKSRSPSHVLPVRAGQ